MPTLSSVLPFPSSHHYLRVIKIRSYIFVVLMWNNHISKVWAVWLIQLRHFCIPTTDWIEHLVSQRSPYISWDIMLGLWFVVSWLQTGHSLSHLFITVTQSGLSSLQQVLINDSSRPLKAFSRMIFQFRAGIQVGTQKYQASISASTLPSHPLSTLITFSCVVQHCNSALLEVSCLADNQFFTWMQLGWDEGD